jgi:outer membrane receptor protein involved in Fe transport
MKNETMKGRLLRSSMLAGVAVSMVAVEAPAFAQEEGVEEIFVTGSRIGRSNLTSPTPVTVFDEMAIDISGAQNVAELLRELPAAGVTSLTSTSSNFFVGSSGLNAVELRNLGTSRTLVLVNGRRFVGGVPGSSVVDFNSIPTEFIKRIETITGGASSIYGSDALAGVINIILKDDMEGLTFTTSAGISEEGDDESYAASITAGSNFGGGRGNALANVSWNRENGVYSRNRSIVADDDISGIYFGDPFDTQITPFYSSYTEWGRFAAINPATLGTASDYFLHLADGSITPMAQPTYGFNRNAFRAIKVPTERIMFNSVLNYDVSDYARFYFEGTYASTETKSSLEPFPLHSDDVFGDNGGISIADNAMIPAALLAAIYADAGAVVPTELRFVRRMTEVDQRSSDNLRQTARFVIGFDGEFANGYTWDTNYTFGRTTQDQRGTGQINVFALRQGLIVEDDGAGAFQCADAVARALGCVPVNMFGKGAISPEAASWIRANSQTSAHIQQQVLTTTVVGDLFEMPAGALGFAIGVEYRQEESAAIPNALQERGLDGGNVVPITKGSYDVKEGFLEISAPLIRDRELIHALDLGGSMRLSQYSNAGNATAWSVNLEYSPIEDVRFRGQLSRAVRAPDIGELFQGAAETFAGVTDPCNGINIADTDVVALNCLSNAAILARATADLTGPGDFILSQAEIQGTGGFNSGNPNLEVETADTTQFGVIYSPGAGPLAGLAISVDYYNIEIDDVIASISRGQTITQCYASVGLSDPLCNNLVRDINGALKEVNTAVINGGTMQAEGIDVAASYPIDLNYLNWHPLGGSDAGEMIISLQYNNTMTYEINDVDFNGEVGSPEHKATLAAVYNVGALQLAWDVNYRGDSDVFNSDAAAGYDVAVGYRTKHDIQARYQVMDGQATLIVGVDNVFDEYAPYLGGSYGNDTGVQTSGAIFDPVGRRFYAGLRLDF